MEQSSLASQVRDDRFLCTRKRKRDTDLGTKKTVAIPHAIGTTSKAPMVFKRFMKLPPEIRVEIIKLAIQSEADRQGTWALFGGHVSITTNILDPMLKRLRNVCREFEAVFDRYSLPLQFFNYRGMTLQLETLENRGGTFRHFQAVFNYGQQIFIEYWLLRLLIIGSTRMLSCDIKYLAVAVGNDITNRPTPTVSETFEFVRIHFPNIQKLELVLPNNRSSPASYYLVSTIRQYHYSVDDIIDVIDPYVSGGGHSIVRLKGIISHMTELKKQLTALFNKFRQQHSIWKSVDFNVACVGHSLEISSPTGIYLLSHDLFIECDRNGELFGYYEGVPKLFAEK